MIDRHYQRRCAAAVGGGNGWAAQRDDKYGEENAGMSHWCLEA